MKTIFKWLVIALSIAVILLLLAAFLLPRFLDSETIKNELAEQASSALGSPVAIHGDLNFSVFPRLAVDISEVSIGDPAVMAQPAGSFEQASVRVALAPLLKRNILIKGLTLEGGELQLRDDESDTDLQLSQLNLDLGALDLRNLSSSEIPLQLEGVFSDLTLGLSRKIDLVAQARVDPAQQQASLGALELTIHELGGGRDLLLTSPELKLNLNAQTLRMERFGLKFSELDVAGSIEASNILDAPGYIASVSVQPFSPKALLVDLGETVPETTDPTVLEAAQMIAQIRGGENRMIVNQLEARLDDSILTGEVVVRQFQKTTLDFELKIDELNADRYMAPVEEVENTDEDPLPPGALPIGALTMTHAEGTLSINRLQLMGVPMNQAFMRLKSGDGKARFHPFTAQLYGGNYEGDIRIDANGQKPVIRFNERLRSVDLGALVAEMTGIDSITGTVNMQLQGSGSGMSTDQLISSLAGGLEFALSDGALEGIDVWHQVRSALAMVRKVENTSQNSGRTVFSNLALQADMENGLLSTDSFNAQLPFLNLSGIGMVDLNSMDLDLGLNATVRQVPEISNDPLTSGLAGRSLPLRIRGPLSAPAVDVDAGKLLQGAITERLLERLNEKDEENTEADSDEDSSEDPASALLRGLLGGNQKKDEPETDGDG